MSRTPNLPILLLPPPGPLTWVFPELLAIEAVSRGVPGGETRGHRGPVLDLATFSGPDGGLVETILRATPEEVRVPPGPRGDTLRTWLAPRLREHGVPVVVARAESCPPVLETWLESVARPAPSGEALDLGDGLPHIVPLRPGPGLERDLANLLARVREEAATTGARNLVPVYLSAFGVATGGDAVETRMPLSWWGLFPGDRYPPGVRGAARDLIRRLRPSRCFQFAALENLALAGVDSYGEALLPRFPLAPEAGVRGGPRRRPLIIGVDGIDGSGKSSHVQTIRTFLESQGLTTAVHKMYRHGVFHQTVTDVTRGCAGGKNLHLWRLQRLAKAFDSVKFFHAVVAPDLATHDALVFDRYTFTHHAAGAGRFHHDPFTRELLSVYPPPDRAYLIDVPVGEALRRIGQREDRTVDENPYMLGRYRHALGDMAGREGLVVIDGRDPAEENRRLIREDLMRVIAAWRAGANP